MSQPYFICSLPRCRSAWLANLLTTGPSFCYHEALSLCRNVDELAAMFQRTRCPFYGDADPAIGLCALDVLDRFPDARFVFVHRPVEDCLASELAAMEDDGHPSFESVTRQEIHRRITIAVNGLDDLWKALPIDRKTMVMYSGLDREEIVRSIWSFCLPGVTFNRLRYDMLDSLRITQIFSKVLKRLPNESFLERSLTHA